ncbi:MAG: beta-ketoacyl-[acyl-carrier-protein] synthase family protein [Candidatus Binatia bacterium]
MALGRRRAVITGMGLVTPFGVGVEPYWRSVLDGISGVSQISHFDPSGLPCRFAGHLRDGALQFDFSAPGDCIGEPRFVLFAMAASRLASGESGWVGSVDPGRAGVYLGTSGERPSLAQLAGIAYEARSDGGEVVPCDYIRVWGTRMKGAVQRFLPQYATITVARELSILGPVTTISTACTSSAHAIGEALRSVQRGTVELAIAGGSECIVSQVGLQIFSPLGVLSRRNEAPEKASRPFDAERDGFVLGEGAGILVVEDMDSALQRGAPILAELAGYGTSCDAYRITDEAPDGRGAILAMRRALEDASLSSEDIDYINAHGTSTPMNDRVETQAIKAVFGSHASEIPVSSTKSMIGHTISAAGAVELITCVLALRDQTIPPTINYESPDPECDLDYVPNRARRAVIGAALSNSFGFGGHNDCLVVRAFRP